MKNDRMFLKCEKCGNIIDMIQSSGVTPVCCNEKMKELTPNTVDAAQEKHIPVGSRDGIQLSVSVGSVLHPMLEKHHIAWIAIAQGKSTQRVMLDYTGEPVATFSTSGDEPITMYAYCNLHGLWAAEL